MCALTVGPFVLEEPIGKGATGSVWRGRHRERGVPVAVKLFHGAPGQERAILHEARAVARLDHPGIAWIFDFGTVSATSAARSEGTLAEGSPYLVMELANRGTLADLASPCSWPELRAILHILLDALAHAHARGLIHRDLKPANVLLCGPDDLRPGPKLCDFGIALDRRHVSSYDTVAGTLHYMAPEQFDGDERSLGPWTDLYALGCLCYRLLCGAPPFAGKRHMQIALAHTQEPPPPLRSSTPLPEGFDAWVAQLLEKDPRRRFQCAAHAAQALQELGHPGGCDLHAPLRPGLVHPVLQARIRTRDGPTSLPLDWRRPARPKPSLDLIGAGLKLFGLRETVFVGREQERDRLWTTLIDVLRTGGARGVLLRGPAGTGKSRLAAWIAERAAEVGAATVLTARFTEEDALRQMLLRHLSATRLEGDALVTHLRRQLRATQVEPEELVLRFLAHDEQRGASRYVVIRLLLEAMAKQHPVVLLLDDLQVGMDGVRFARHLLNAQAIRPCPIFLLSCARPPEPSSPIAAEMRALVADPNMATLEIGPLPREPFVELVQDLIGLEPELARIVVDRTAGNPQFAIQIVGDWIHRDQLELGSRGFKLKRGIRPKLPPDLKYVWIKRLAHALQGAPPEVEPLLEAAAVLGMEVDRREWAGMCDDPEGLHRDDLQEDPVRSQLRQRLVDRLVRLDLARESARGFTFLHGEFRNAILDRARAHRRLRALHRAAACQIDIRRDTELERYGRHLLAAREREAALDPLLRAVPAVQATVGRMSAWRLLDTVEHTMRRLDLPASDIRWGRLYIERATLADHLGKATVAVRFATKAGHEASRYGWRPIAARANFLLAHHARRAGDITMAEARALRVTLQNDREQNPFLTGEALFLLGEIAWSRGDRAEAAQRFKAGKRLMFRDPRPRNRVRALLHLARVAIERGRTRHASELLEKAHTISMELGDLPQRVQCLVLASEVAQRDGDPHTAVRKLRRAIEVFELIGDAQLALLRAKLAIVLLEAGYSANALQELERAFANAVSVGRPTLELAVQAARLRVLATEGRLRALDETILEVNRLLEEVPVPEPDGGHHTERAAALLERQGDRPRALQVLRLAVEHHRKLQNPGAVARLEGRINALRGRDNATPSPPPPGTES